MAASNADTGYGVDLLKETATPGTYASFGAEVISINPPNLSRTSIERTHALSPNNAKEYFGGMIEGGEVGLTVAYIPSDSDAVYAEIGAATANWQILFDTSIAWNFAGFVTNYAPQAPIDDRMTANVTIKITGLPTLSDES
ncbi:MAG: hypothetical protein KDJ19_00715 [Hyphomicrobiaceae bacterium]|nr:hypothetical protein [Hyphomicrobiaceae bacterium]MCC0024630.1 hypothetical protein [Hyphomicrobiaceae bacterium]